VLRIQDEGSRSSKWFEIACSSARGQWAGIDTGRECRIHTLHTQLTRKWPIGRWLPTSAAGGSAALGGDCLPIGDFLCSWQCAAMCAANVQAAADCERARRMGQMDAEEIRILLATLRLCGAVCPVH
jgi:hypothetical protein